jgi:hypothetical protein
VEKEAICEGSGARGVMTEGFSDVRLIKDILFLIFDRI